MADPRPTHNALGGTTPLPDAARVERSRLMEDPDLRGLAETLATGMEPHPPSPWRLVHRGQDGALWKNPGARLSAIWSVEAHDGSLWFHASLAGRDGVPTWAQFAAFREWAIPGERDAYQVLPPRERWVDINPNVLHLFAPVGVSRILPDFTAGSGSL